MNNTPGQKALLLFVTVPPGLVLALHSYLGYFTRLMADDFCSYNDAQRFHILRYIWYSYKVWAGRYAAVASDEILDTIGPLGVRYIPLAVLLIWVTAACLMCHYTLQNSVTKKPNTTLSIALGVILVFAISATSPGFDKLLYWWNGMRTYIPALISLTFHLALLFWAKDQTFTKRKLLIAGILSFLFALFSGGFNETFTAVHFLAFIGFTGLWALTKRPRLSSPMFVLLCAASLGAILSLTIMVISPGAAERRQLFSPVPPDISTMLEIAINGYSDYMYEMVNSPEQIALWIGLIMIFFWAGASSHGTVASPWLIFFTVTSGVLLSFASLLPSAYGLSGMPGTRTFSVPTYILILSVAYTALLCGEWLATVLSSNTAKSAVLFFTAAVISFSALSIAKTMYANREVYISYARLWDQVDSMIKEAKQNGEPSITIPAMGGWARLDSPNENPKWWPTACYTEYYDIQVYGPPYGP